MSLNREMKYHPSYGRITLSKPSAGGGGVNLFGSKVKHPSFVSIEIEEAQISEDGYSEFIYGGKGIVKVYLSEAQWAHMVSSFGDGSGTPVTIAWRPDIGYVDAPPAPTPILDLAHKTANDTKNDLVKRLKLLQSDVSTLSSKSGTVTKKDLKQLALDFNILASWLDSNFDFLENQVKERMEKEVAKAHIEIDALIGNAVQRLGERALGVQLAAGEKIEIQGLTDGRQGADLT
jgi:hypothetical protein